MTVYLADYQTFADKAELNYHVKQHLDATYEEINATDRNIFKFIARHAVKYAGASHLKVATIAEAIGKTERTVRAILAKLERLGIIKRITRMRRKSGGQGANIIVILPYELADTSEGISEPTSSRTEAKKPTEATEEPSKTKKEPLYKQFLSSSNTLLDTKIGGSTRIGESTENHPRALRQAIPQVIYNALAPYFDADGLYRTYGILLRAKATVNKEIRVETHGEKYVDVFLNVVRLRKKGKVKKSFDGYLFTAWKELSTRITQSINAVSRGVYFDWLNVESDAS